MLLCWRRASTLCKAPLKKSNSTVFSASRRFTLSSSLRSADSRELMIGWPSSACEYRASRSSRHLYNKASSHPEFLRQAHDVVAGIHLFYRATTKLLAVALPSLSLHFADLLCKV